MDNGLPTLPLPSLAKPNLAVIVGYFVEYEAASVPEPSTWALMLLGFGAIALIVYNEETRRRSRLHAA